MTHTQKKKVIENLVIVPTSQKRNFWGREIKTLNILLETYPCENFWNLLSFPKKVDSMIVFRSGYYKEELLKRYRRYFYVAPKQEKVIIGEKCGEDYYKKTIHKTLRQFCDDKDN